MTMYIFSSFILFAGLCFNFALIGHTIDKTELVGSSLSYDNGAISQALFNLPDKPETETVRRFGNPSQIVSPIATISPMPLATTMPTQPQPTTVASLPSSDAQFQLSNFILILSAAVAIGGLFSSIWRTRVQIKQLQNTLVSGRYDYWTKMTEFEPRIPIFIKWSSLTRL